MKDSLDILLDNVSEDVTEYEPEFVAHDSLNILRTDVICHHGVLGMRWGIRRYQPYEKGYSGAGKFIGDVKRGVQKKYRNIRDRKYREYDTTYTKVGSATGTRSKYTNIDGSLNEKGRFHSQAYINKQLKKNEKYYDKVIKKYNKRAEEYTDDPVMRKKFQDLAKEAEDTKNAVDASIKKMDFDSVMRNESYDHEQAIKAIKTAAGVTIGAAGGSLMVGASLGLANAMKKNPEVKNAMKSFDTKNPIDSTINIINSTEIGKKGFEATDTALRTYFDARAYVIGTGLDQANIRLQKLGVYDSFGKSIGQSMKTASQTSGFTPEVAQSISSNLKESSSNLTKISNSEAAKHFIASGTETVNKALENPGVCNTLTNLNYVNSPEFTSAVMNEIQKKHGPIIGNS